MSLSTILITASRPAAIATIIINRGPTGPEGPPFSGNIELPEGLADFTSISVVNEQLVMVLGGTTYTLNAVAS